MSSRRKVMLPIFNQDPYASPTWLLCLGEGTPSCQPLPCILSSIFISSIRSLHSKLHGRDPCVGYV